MYTEIKTNRREQKLQEQRGNITTSILDLCYELVTMGKTQTFNTLGHMPKYKPVT